MALGENTISGKMGLTQDGYVPQAMQVSDTVDTLTISDTSDETAALTAGDSGVTSLLVRLSGNANCWVEFGADPTAVAGAGTSIFLPAGAIEYMRMQSGHKISVIQEASETGSLSVAVME